MSGTHNKVVLQFIETADALHFPTTMLKRVVKKASFGIAAPNETERTKDGGKTILLHQDTYDALQSISLDGAKAQPQAIASLYHEATHALLWNKTGKAAEIFTRAEKYYAEALTEDGGTPDDPAQAADEAATSYVNERVNNFWHTYYTLHKYIVRFGTDPDVFVAKANKLQADYDRDMSKKVAGYAVLKKWLVKKSTPSLMTPLPYFLSHYLDYEVLEGVMPDKFNDVELFSRILIDAGLVEINTVAPKATERRPRRAQKERRKEESTTSQRTARAHKIGTSMQNQGTRVASDSALVSSRRAAEYARSSADVAAKKARASADTASKNAADAVKRANDMRIRATMQSKKPWIASLLSTWRDPFRRTSTSTTPTWRKQLETTNPYAKGGPAGIHTQPIRMRLEPMRPGPGSGWNSNRFGSSGSSGTRLYWEPITKTWD